MQARSLFPLKSPKEELKELAQKRFSARLVITVYCQPPLFTSRLIPTLYEDRPFLSPRNEVYRLVKKAGLVEIYADMPVSWLEQLPVLRSFGYGNFLIDLSEGGPKESGSLGAVLSGFAASRSPTKNFSLFNFERRP